MKMCKCYYFNLFLLTRGDSCLIPSNLVLVLQCGSGTYSDFVAKILGVDTPLLLFNTQLYFLHYSFWFYIPLTQTGCHVSCSNNVV
jgi:hypothetical protein